MCKTIKQIHEIAKTSNIKGVFSYNKKQLDAELAKLYGHQPRGESTLLRKSTKPVRR